MVGNWESEDATVQTVDDHKDIMPGAGYPDTSLVAADLVGRLVVVATDEGVDEVSNGRDVVFDQDTGTGNTMNFAK